MDATNVEDVYYHRFWCQMCGFTHDIGTPCADAARAATANYDHTREQP